MGYDLFSVNELSTFLSKNFLIGQSNKLLLVVCADVKATQILSIFLCSFTSCSTSLSCLFFILRRCDGNSSTFSLADTLKKILIRFIPRFHKLILKVLEEKNKDEIKNFFFQNRLGVLQYPSTYKRAAIATMRRFKKDTFNNLHYVKKNNNNC